MARRNDLRRRKAAFEFQKKREEELAAKRRQRRKKIGQKQYTDRSEVEEDPMLPREVRQQISKVKNLKARRRMTNEIRRLALKGIIVRAKPQNEPDAEETMETDQHESTLKEPQTSDAQEL